MQVDYTRLSVSLLRLGLQLLVLCGGCGGVAKGKPGGEAVLDEAPTRHESFPQELCYKLIQYTPPREKWPGTVGKRPGNGCSVLVLLGALEEYGEVEVVEDALPAQRVVKGTQTIHGRVKGRQ